MDKKDIEKLNVGDKIIVDGIDCPVEFTGLEDVLDYGSFDSIEDAISAVGVKEPESITYVTYKHKRKKSRCLPKDVLGSFVEW